MKKYTILKYHVGFSRKLSAVLLLTIAIFLVDLAQAYGQHFGRNRPGYMRFDWQVFESPHFRIFHYFENDSVVHALANRLEHWYILNQKLFKDTFERPSPVLIYRNHPEFQQTTAISGSIGIGTLGVAEALKNRIVMPILESNAQTDHVLAHEVVHVFHFRALLNDDSLSLSSLRNLPLWLVEGMAEYFSVGSVDAHTAMIMRDAIIKDDFPSLRDMTRDYSAYNPYRYGHAFVAFVGRNWGDDVIVPLYREAAKFGYERAIERVLGLNANIVSSLWSSSTNTHVRSLLTDQNMLAPRGQVLMDASNAGNINISPSLSPDGNFVAFFSEKDLFSIDLFLANAQTGRIIRTLSSTTRNVDIDAFNFFESVGTWSPDGNKFVHVAVRRGRNELVIVDVNRPRRSRTISVEGVPALNNPAWSPDGRYMVFSGLQDGIGNLFKLDMETYSVERLTNDRYSYIHPSWSPDGRYITFATDLLPGKFNPDTLSYSFYIGIMDVQSPDRAVTVLDVFPSADNLNPVFDHEQRGIYFLSNRDGFRNLYHYLLEEQKVYQLTNYFTGISGITHQSPAISVARNTGQIAYSYYFQGNYTIYKANPSDFERIEVNPFDVDMAAATLAPLNRITTPVIDDFMSVHTRQNVFPEDSFRVREFRPQFGLTFIGSSGVGVASSRFGTGVAGGVAMMFSDIVGNNQLFSSLAVNGEIIDFGGQIGYLNQRNRINWGGSVTHTPFTSAIFTQSITTDNQGNPLRDFQFNVQRTFETQLGLFAFYPVSVSRRIEVTATQAWYYFRRDIFHTYYDLQSGVFRARDRSRGVVPDGFNLQRFGIGYVGDNSFFGMASPMAGQRYRFSVEQLFGILDMTTLTADYRKYWFPRPFSIAFRATHIGRYGNNSQNNLFYPLFLGYPGFMRGYDYGSLFRIREQVYSEGRNFNFDKLQGTRMVVGGLELRLPFSGPERLALIPSRLFLTELNWYFDAGLAWRQGSNITLNPDAMANDNRFPVFSTGPSLRVNLLGALILEPFYAFPFALNERWPGVWGVNFWPGW